MALITCPECGREISDKAVSCPGCGCPNLLIEIDRIKREQSNERIKEIYDKVAGESPIWTVDKRTIMTLQDEMKIDKKTAQKMLDDYRCNLRAKYKEEHGNSFGDRFVEEFQKQLAERKIPQCPKCKSTSISYTTKKLSLGRTVVGAAVAGAPGAVIGGLSSKKGYAVCLNCGKKWKI